MAVSCDNKVNRNLPCGGLEPPTSYGRVKRLQRAPVTPEFYAKFCYLLHPVAYGCNLVKLYVQIFKTGYNGLSMIQYV